MNKINFKNYREIKYSKNKFEHIGYYPRTFLITLCFGICSASLFNPEPLIAMEKPEAIPKTVQGYSNQNFYKIDNINAIYNLISDIRAKEQNETPKILVAFDWDNTISMVDGCELPLREENTKEVIENLATHLNTKIFVLTSRLNGGNVDQVGKNSLIIAKRMHQALPILTQSTPLKGVGDFQIKDTNNYVLYDNGIVFAGSSDNDKSCSTSGSCKGKALAQLIDGVDIQTGENEFKKVNLGEFDVLIFVDNDRGHLDAVQEAFAQRPDREKIHLIYYKQNPKLGSEFWHLCETLK